MLLMASPTWTLPYEAQTRQHKHFGAKEEQSKEKSCEKTSYLVSVVLGLVCHQKPDHGLPSAQGLGVPGSHHQDQLLGGHLQVVGGVQGPVRPHLEVQAVGFVPHALVTSTVIKFY